MAGHLVKNYQAHKMQEYMTLEEEKNQSVKAIPELAQVLELADEDIKTVAVTTFKKPEEN